MTTSQNGWPTNREIGPLLVAGVSFPGGVAHHDGAFIVLTYVATQWHYRVEKLRKGWCWGYNMRPVRGQNSGYSNHAAGTALDHNAPLHPRGVPVARNLNPTQVATIHKILAEVNNLGHGTILRWGGDYQISPKDAMHIEIVAGESAVLAAANDIVKKNMNVVGPFRKVVTTLRPAPSKAKARRTVMAAAGSSVVNVHSVTRDAAKNADALDVQKVLNHWYPQDKVAEDGIWGDASWALLDKARAGFKIAGHVDNATVRTKTLQKLGFTVKQA